MTFSQIVSPYGAHRNTPNYVTLVDADGVALDMQRSPAVPWPVTVGATVAAGDAVYVVAGTSTYPPSVSPLPAAATAAQQGAFVGWALQGATGAASTAPPVIQVVPPTSGNIVQVNVETAVTPAVGDRVVIVGGTTAGKVNKSTAALDAALISGSIGGSFLTLKNASDKAFIITARY